MAFENGNSKDGKHYWLTPPDLMKQLQEEFHFDFDPCPYPDSLFKKAKRKNKRTRINSLNK